MDSLFQNSDIFFFKIQQQLFYLLTISDDNPEKNVFVNKDYYDEIIKKNYLAIKDVSPNNNNDNNNNNNNNNGYDNSIQDKNYNSYKNKYDNLSQPDRNRDYNGYPRDNFKSEPPYQQNNINRSNEPPYPRNPNDYYNPRDENNIKMLGYNQEQKPYPNRDYALDNKDYRNDRYPLNSDYRSDDPSLMNRKDYDDRYNNNCSSRSNSNDTNNDPNIMIPNNNNNRNIPSASSSYLSSYSYNEQQNRYPPSDNYYDNRDKRLPNSGPDNNSNNHKNSINFINGNNNYDQGINKEYNRNPENNSYMGKNGQSPRDNYLPRDPYGMRDRDRGFPDDPHYNVNRKSPINDDEFYRNREDNYNVYSLPHPQSSNRSGPPTNEQNLHLPSIHEYIGGFNNNSNSNNNTNTNNNNNNGPYGRPNDRFERDSFDKYSSRERYDPVRNNTPPNDYRDDRNGSRYPPPSAINDCPDGRDSNRYPPPSSINDRPDGRNNNRYPPPSSINDRPDGRNNNRYPPPLSINDRPDDRNSNRYPLPSAINDRPDDHRYPPSFNDYKNDYPSNRYPPVNSYGKEPTSKYSDYCESDEYYSKPRGSFNYHDEPQPRSQNNRSSINNLLNSNNSNNNNINNNNNSNSNQVVPNSSRSNYSIPPYSQERNDYGMPPRDRIEDPFYSQEERSRKRSLDYINDDNLRKRPMSSMDDMRGRPLGTLPPIDSMRNGSQVNGPVPPIDSMRNGSQVNGPIPPIDSRRNGSQVNGPIPPVDSMRNGSQVNGPIPPIDSMRNGSQVNGPIPPIDKMRNRPLDDFDSYNKPKSDNPSMYYRNMNEGPPREDRNNDYRYYSNSNSYERRAPPEKYNDYNQNRPYDQYPNNDYRRDTDYDVKPNFSHPNSSYPYDLPNYPRSPVKSEPRDNNRLFNNLSLDMNSFNKKSEGPLSITTPQSQLPISAIDMLEEENDGKQNFYPTIKYKFKNYRVSDIEKERLLDINFDYIVHKNSPEDIRSFQNVMKFISPIIIDRFLDINDIVVHRYLLNQYINFEILEYFFHNLNKFFSNNISSGNPIFLLVLVENSEFLNFIPDHLSNLCIRSVLKFSRQRIKLSKRDIYRYYLYRSQIKLIVRQCGSIRDLMINILNAAYIKHDVEQIKKIYNYPDIINTYKLVKACVNNDTSQISHIIKETSTALFYQTIQGYTPLHLAINSDNIDIVKILLQCQKVDVNIYDKYGFSPIFYSILKKRYDVLRMLLSHPSVNVNRKNVTGLSPLLFTVVLRNKEALKILLSHPDIDINITGKHNNTALINLLSNTRNYIEDYQRMVYHYFSLEGSKMNYNEVGNVMYKSGKNEEEYINKKFILNKISSISEVPLQQNELMIMIIEHPNIDLSKKNDYYNNALFYAAKNFNIEIVSRILRKGNSFDVNERLFNGKTVFHKTIKKSDRVVKGVRKTSSTEVMNINNIIIKRDQSGASDIGNPYYNSNDPKFKHPDMNGNNLRPILPSPSSSSNTPNSNLNTPQSANMNYYNGGSGGGGNDGKSLDEYNNYTYGGGSGGGNGHANGGPMNPRYLYEQDRSSRPSSYYPSSSLNEYGGGESIFIGTLYKMMMSDHHQTIISHHDNVDGCQYCMAYLNFLNNINDEYERLVQLSTEDIIRYEIIKLFLESPKVNVNVQDDKGITPIMKAVMCQRFDLLILILRMRLLKIDFTLKNYQNETSLQIANRLGYDDIIQLHLIHKVYLQHVYQ
ncbi:hypothetical protein PIROE2DRAFT_20617 [Piromyces sp. E2]|nr:hypothetical protein PIROE2DRAFT_20617 [Piromyces sp. E2]|eukprot:OUM63872.1 hypothetical protein PIROE2DRAFT_20617 [Piromyces sp. E2]